MYRDDQDQIIALVLVRLFETGVGSSTLTTLGPVVQRPISTNPWLHVTP